LIQLAASTPMWLMLNATVAYAALNTASILSGLAPTLAMCWMVLRALEL
jgi:hypothetical protein